MPEPSRHGRVAGPARSRFLRVLAVLGKATVAVAMLIVIVGLLVHVEPVRRAVLRRAVAEIAARTGVVLTAGSLQYNLTALRVTLSDVALAADGDRQWPFFTADAVEIAVSPSALFGPFSLDSVRLDNARVDIARRANGAMNLPARGVDADGNPRIIVIGHIDVPRLAVSVVDEKRDVALNLPALAVQVHPDGGSLRLGQTGSFRRADVTTSISRMDGGMSFDGRVVRVDRLSVATSEGSVQLDAALALIVRAPHVDASVQGTLDVARVARWAAGDMQVDGRLSFQGSVTGPLVRPSARVEVSSARLAVGSIVFGDTSAEIETTGDGLRVSRAATRVFNGRVTASGTYLFSNGRSLVAAQWRDVDTAVVQRALFPSAAVTIGSIASGSLSVDGIGLDWTGWTTEARMRLEARTAAPQQLPIRGAIVVNVANRLWRVGADVSIGPASARARLDGRVGAGEFGSSTLGGTVVVQETDVLPLLETLRPIGLDVAADAGVVSGSVTADAVVGGTLRAPRVMVNAAARDLAIRGWSNIDADFLAIGDQTRLEVNGRFRHGDANTARVAGIVRPVAGRLDVDVSATARDMASLFADAAGRVDLHVRTEGPFEALSIRGSATLTDVSYHGMRIGRVDATLDVDPLVARVDIVSAELDARARAAIDRATRQASIELRVADASLATILHAAGVSANVSGNLDLTGRANLPIDDWRSGTATLDVARLDARTGNLPIRLSEPARVAYAAGAVTISQFEADVAGTTLSIAGGLPVTSSDTSTGITDSVRAVLAGNLAQVIEAARASGITNLPELAGRGDLALLARVTGSVQRPDIAADVELRDGELTYAAMPPIRSVHLRGRVADGRVDLLSATAEWQESRLGAKAQLPLTLLQSYLPSAIVTSGDTAAMASLDATIEGVTPRVIEPFLDTDTAAQLDGRLAMAVQLEAPSLDIDSVNGEVTFNQLELRLAGLPVAQRVPTRLTIDRGVARVASWEWTGQGATLTVQGEIRLGEREAALLAAGRWDLRTLTPFVGSAGVALSGTLAPRVAIVGPLRSPRIDGELALTAGEIRLREPRLVVADVNAFGVVTPSGARVTQLTGTINGGALAGSASANYAVGRPWTAELLGQIDGMGLEFPAGLRSDLDANLTLTLADTSRGATGTLSGTATVVRSAYRQPIAVMTRLLTTLRADHLVTAGTDSMASRIALNVRVGTDTDVLVDNNVARLQLGGDLRVIGTAATPALSGRAVLPEGGQLFLGRNVYSIESGTLDFTNPDTIEPNLHVEATTRAGGHDIELVLSGPPETMDVDLRSLTEPALGQTDVASLLLTGRLLEDVPGSEARIVGEQVLAYVSGDVLGVAGRAVGFDSIRLGAGSTSSLRRDPAAVAAEADPISRLTFGKTFGEAVEVTFSQSLRQGGASTWIVDYRPVRQVNLRLVSRDDNLRSYEFRHDVSFGAGRTGDDAAPRRARHLKITGVEIVGSAPLTDKALRDAVQLESGDTFDVARWQRARDRLEQALWEAGFFEARVRTTRQDGPAGVTLSFDMAAGPRTILAISGYELPRATREAIATAWTQTVFDDFLREEAEALVRSVLTESGFVAPQVITELTEDDTKTLAIRVMPGPRARARRISIDAGDAALSRDLERWVREHRLQELAWREPDSLARTLVAELRRRGRIEARVVALEPRIEASTAVFKFEVQADVRYTIAEVRLPVEEQVAVDLLRTAADLARGTAYDPDMVEAARIRIARVYRREGFAEARVSAQSSVNSADRTVVVTFDADPGPRDVLREIDVRGTEAIDNDVVTRALDLKVGEPLGADAWLQARARLFDTSLFRRVDVAAEPLADATMAERSMRVVATVQEWPALRVRYGFQLSEEHPEREVRGRSIEPGLSADATRRTLFGRALTVGAAAEVQRRERLTRVFASAPTFAGLPVESLFTIERVHENVAAGTLVSDRNRVSWEQRAKVATPFRVSYSYSFERNRTLDTGPLDPLAPAFDVTVNVARLTGAAVFDTRDDPTDATRGSLVSLNVEYAPATLGSDVSFIRQVAQAYYFKPWRGLTLASAARLGIVVPRGSQPLLPGERLFAGGARTVRGVAEDGLGPADVFGNAAGGQASVVFNQEVRVPMYRWLRGIGFIDAGNVFVTPSSISVQRLTGAVGGGLRIATPFALLRVDYGRVVFGTPMGSARWTFGIGQTF